MTYTPYKLFSDHTRQPKMAKTEKEAGVRMMILHLAPAKSSGVTNVCPMASKGCEKACLNWAGFSYSRKQAARVKKTKLFIEHRWYFMSQLALEVDAAQRSAQNNKLRCGVRLNGTSDIRWENIRYGNGKNIMQLFPNVAFMDYTKLANRKNLPENYKLVFSRSENNEGDCYKALHNGMNVCVVFARDPLPKQFMGHRVIDGDIHDWRYGDYEEFPNERLIIGVRAKGKLGHDDVSGFVVQN